MAPALRRRAGGIADALLAGLWSAGFLSLSRLRPTHTRLWSSPGGSRVLVVAAHPDDEVAGCAGTLVRHRQAGDVVTVAVVTDGRRSRALGLAPDEMAARRRREAVAVAALLKVELCWLGLPEGGWHKEELQAQLRPLLASLDPAMVYAPSAVDFHPEHVGVARALAEVLPESPSVRVYPAQVPLGASLVNLVSPVLDLMPSVAEAMAAYASQEGSLRRCLRLRAYAGARHGHGGAAEEFWEMTAGAYRALHAAAEGPRLFRSLRHRAFADPLAYVAGRRERLRLRAQVQGKGAS